MSELTTKSVAELEIDMAELRVARQRLVAEKCGWLVQLAEINAQLKTKLPQARYHQLMAHRANILKGINSKEQEILTINSRHTELNTVREFRKAQENALTLEDIRLLVGIRDRMHELSMDKEQPKSAREVCFKFSQELKAVLKKHFK